MSEPHFSLLGPEDADLVRSVCDIHGRLPAEWGDDEPVTEEQTAAFVTRLVRSLREGRGWCEIVTLGDEMVAYMWSEIHAKAPELANIVSLWTRPDHRRQGLARRLKVRMEGWARGSGVKRILTGVSPRNTAVVAMNESLGYRVAMLRMEKNL